MMNEGIGSLDTVPSRLCINVRDFGARGDGITDDTVPVKAAIAFVATSTFHELLYFPSGTYIVTDALVITERIEILGETNTTTRIQYNGLAAIPAVVTIDGTGHPPSGLFANRMENITVSGNANATDALLLKSIHHSVFRNLNLRNCIKAGLELSFAVANVFDNVATSKVAENYVVAPNYGVYMDNVVTANLFLKPQVDLVNITGMYFGLTNCSNNVVSGGLIEACGQYGIHIAATAASNMIIDVDAEINVVANFFVSGDRNILQNCLSGDGGTGINGLLSVINGGQGNQVIGGHYVNLTVMAGAKATLLNGVSHQGVFTDNGQETSKIFMIDITGGGLVEEDYRNNLTNFRRTVRLTNALLKIEQTNDVNGPVQINLLAGHDALNRSAVLSYYAAEVSLVNPLWKIVSNYDQTSVHDLRIMDQVNNPVIHMLQGGKVAIGTSAPSNDPSLLHVNSNIIPHADNSFYLGRNSTVGPQAWKGVILRDQVTANYYRIEMRNGVLTSTLM